MLGTKDTIHSGTEFGKTIAVPYASNVTAGVGAGEGVVIVDWPFPLCPQAVSRTRKKSMKNLPITVARLRGVTSRPDSQSNLDNRVLAALDQSGLPAFLPYSGKLSHQVRSASAYGLERAPAWTNDSPTTLRACSSARGPGLLPQGVPPQASPIQDVPEQGVSHSRLSRPRFGMYKRENLYFLEHAFYSILH